MGNRKIFRNGMIFFIGSSLILAGCSLNGETSKPSKETPNVEESRGHNDESDSGAQVEIITKEPEQTESPKQESEPVETQMPEQTQETQLAQADENEAPNDNLSESAVSATVQLNDINYFDESILAFHEDNVVDGQYIADDYYELVITNVTDTTFDFTVFEVNAETGAGEVVFLTNTAVFTGDGATAAFYGNEYTLSFSFPDNHSSYPVVTSIEVSGFSPIEGITFTNNSIPGYEFN